MGIFLHKSVYINKNKHGTIKVLIIQKVKTVIILNILLKQIDGKSMVINTGNNSHHKIFRKSL